MKLYFKRICFLSLVVLFAVTCAKKRPDKDLEANRFRIEKSIFSKGRYYFKETVTHSDVLSDAVIGIQGSGRIVRFEFKENFLNILEETPYSEGIKEAVKRGKLKERLISRFPVRHVDIRKAKDYKGDETNEFIETTEDNPWNKRKYAIINFEAEELLDRSTFYDGYGFVAHGFIGIASGGEVTELELKRNIINISSKKRVQSRDRTEFIEIRSSFMPVKKTGYIAMKYPKEWEEHVGFFRKDVISFDKNQRIKIIPYLTRFNPKKRVTFYLSQTWNANEENKKLKKMVYRAIDEWNKVFLKATGIKNYLILKESGPDKKLGDIRYNFVELVEDRLREGLKGFAPSITHPFTGEIIQADVLLYKQAFKRDLWTIRNIIYGGDVEGNSDDQLKVSNFESKAFEFSFKNTNDVSSKLKTIFSTLQSLSAKVKNAHDVMEESVMLPFWEDAKKHGLSEEKIIEKHFLRTTIHEFGHNFGLRHNFMGSVDKNNFYKEKDRFKRYKYQSSSIMDYSSNIFHLLDKPGKYDIAAIKLAYSNDDFPKIPKISKDNFFEKNFNFLYCTDDDLKLNPMCNMFDQGTNAEEIANFLSELYYKTFKYRNQQFEDFIFTYYPGFEMAYIDELMERFFTPLRLFLDYREKQKNRAIAKGLNEKEFIATKEAQDLGRAAKVAMDFFFSVLFSSHEDEHEIRDNGEIKRIGAKLDRQLALLYLMVPNLSEAGLTEYTKSCSFPQLLKEMEIDLDDFMNNYMTAIMGSFKPISFNGFGEDLNSSQSLDSNLRVLAAVLFLQADFNGIINVEREAFIDNRLMLQETDELQTLKDKIRRVFEDEIQGVDFELTFSRDNMPKINELKLGLEEMKSEGKDRFFPERQKQRIKLLNSLIVAMTEENKLANELDKITKKPSNRSSGSSKIDFLITNKKYELTEQSSKVVDLYERFAKLDLYYKDDPLDVPISYVSMKANLDGLKKYLEEKYAGKNSLPKAYEDILTKKEKSLEVVERYSKLRDEIYELYDYMGVSNIEDTYVDFYRRRLLYFPVGSTLGDLLHYKIKFLDETLAGLKKEKSEKMFNNHGERNEEIDVLGENIEELERARRNELDFIYLISDLYRRFIPGAFHN